MAPQFFNIMQRTTANYSALIFVPLLYRALASLGIVLAIWQNVDMNKDAKIIQTDTKDSFDFIVVGAGSAGSVVANRLSRYYDVLLLEAGGEPNPLQSIPAFTLMLLNYPETDWMHRSVPQKYGSLNSVNQQSSWSAGKSLGGSGSINLLLFLRGHKKDWDNYARITGDDSWGYENITQHFKNLETYSDKNADKNYHGFNGDLSVELPSYTGLAEEFVKAGRELGYPEIDVNAPHTEGFFKMYQTSKNGVRHSPWAAFLKPIRQRRSLTIRKYSLVTKILFKNNNEEVYGVQYDRHGKTYRALATKEVIISAGTITSPKLLMLSGVGPKEHLEELGIPVRHNLPVGKNLQDHLAVFLSPIFVDKPRTIVLERDATPGAFFSWLTTGRGVFSTSGALASAVFSSSYAKSRGEGDWPDVQFFYIGTAAFKTTAQVVGKAFNLKLDEFTRYLEPGIGKDSFIISVSGARPVARGFIKLGGTSPYDNLIIDPKYLDDPHELDLKVLVEGTLAALKLVENTTTFQALGARFTDVPLPGCEHLPFRSHEYWICYVRRFSITLHHPCGTASMGKKLDTVNSVVDSELHVHGIKNLRVIDASILPVLIVTNTQAAAMVIGEKGADMILRYWRLPDIIKA